MTIIDRTPPRGGSWPETQWSMVLRFGADKADGRAVAWDDLARRYQRPMEVFVERLLLRMTGQRRPDEARDVVQSFLARGIEKGWLAAADPDKGRFRTYVMGALRNHLKHHIEHDMAKKRQPSKGVAPLTDDQVTSDKRRPTSDEYVAFDECWVAAAVDEAMTQLRAKNERYHLVIQDLMANEGKAGDDLHDRVGLRRQQLPVLVKRARDKLKDYVVEQIQSTVDSEPALLSEWQALQRYLP